MLITGSCSVGHIFSHTLVSVHEAFIQPRIRFVVRWIVFQIICRFFIKIWRSLCVTRNTLSFHHILCLVPRATKPTGRSRVGAPAELCTERVCVCVCTSPASVRLARLQDYLQHAGASFGFPLVLSRYYNQTVLYIVSFLQQWHFTLFNETSFVINNRVKK